MLIHTIGYKNRFSRRPICGEAMRLLRDIKDKPGDRYRSVCEHWLAGNEFPQHLEDPRPCFENRRRVNCLNLISSLFRSCIRIDAPSRVVLYVKGKERLASYKPRETFHFSRITTATLPLLRTLQKAHTFDAYNNSLRVRFSIRLARWEPSIVKILNASSANPPQKMGMSW